MTDSYCDFKKGIVARRPFLQTPFTMNIMFLLACREDRKAQANQKTSPKIAFGHAQNAYNIRKVMLREADDYNVGMPVQA